jgi:hypothetical protein
LGADRKAVERPGELGLKQDDEENDQQDEPEQAYADVHAQSPPFVVASLVSTVDYRSSRVRNLNSNSHFLGIWPRL